VSRLPPRQFAARARKLRLVLFDVDGVLTDGTLAISARGEETKRFHIRDGAAIVWAERAGLMTGLLSGRASHAAERRASDLGMRILSLGATDKRAAFDAILTSHGLDDADVAYMGDDVMDLPVLARVGLSAAPLDAADDVRRRVHWVSRARGGDGAAREFLEAIFRARGVWDGIVRQYLTS